MTERAFAGSEQIRRYMMFKHVIAGRPLRRGVAFALMLFLTVLGASGIVSAKAVYVIDDGETRTVVESRSYTPSAVVRQAGIAIDEGDRILSEPGEDGAIELRILRPQDVSIHYMGATLHVQTYEETVSDLLARMDIEVTEDDIVSVDLSSYTEDGMTVDVTKITYSFSQEVEAATFPVERVPNAEMTKGKEIVTQEGKDGSALVTYKITCANGEEISREAVSSKIVSAPVAEIVEYGTRSASIASSDRIVSDDRNDDGSGVLTFRSGDTLTYSRVFTANATAYTAKPGAHTASGRVVSVGCIAVDPRVIPMGTKLYVTTPNGSIVYGMGIAADTGGAIKGNKIDLFFNTYGECVQFGRRNCTVYVLN